MAELDFSKIFGETATSKASFTDENYLNGWGYLGSTPPPYQLFDYLQGLNDKKSKYLYDSLNESKNNLLAHNTDSSAHENILNTHNADVNAHNPILNAIKAITGTSSYDIAPSKTITAIIPLLGLGGIVAQSLGSNGYVKFANGFTIQWGNTSNSPTTEYTSKATLPIVFLTPFMAVGSIFDSVGTASELNYDDAIKLTSTEIAFRHFGHSYIAIGLA